MAIREETAQLIKHQLDDELDHLTIEKAVLGLFFTGVKISNGAGGVYFTPTKDIPQVVCCPSSAGRIFDPFKIQGMKVEDVFPGKHCLNNEASPSGFRKINTL